jgi:hypothetical protein
MSRIIAISSDVEQSRMLRRENIRLIEELRLSDVAAVDEKRKRRALWLLGGGKLIFDCLMVFWSERIDF